MHWTRIQSAVVAGAGLLVLVGCGSGIAEAALNCDPSPTRQVTFITGNTPTPADAARLRGASPAKPARLATPAPAKPRAAALFEGVARTPISRLGCAKQDVDLNTGRNKNGGEANDDGPCIDAALAKATASNPVVLLQDGASLVSGVHGPAGGNWGIVGQGGGFQGDTKLTGTGFYQKSGTNDDVIVNSARGANCPYGVTDPGIVSRKPATPRGSNIQLRNFVINGNRGDGHNGNSNSGDFHGGSCWLFGISMLSVDNVDISSITAYNTSTYNIRLDDVGHAQVTDSLLANRGMNPAHESTPQNDDGIHINGLSNDVTLTGNTFITSDDAIALNAAEGWGGPIRDVTIRNNTVRQAATLLRMYTNSDTAANGNELATVSNVTIDNHSGTANTCGVFGVGSTRNLTRLETISNIKWANSSCTARQGFGIQDNIRDITFTNFVWHAGGEAGAFLRAEDVSTEVTHITLRNLTIDRAATFPSPLAVLDFRGVPVRDHEHVGTTHVQQLTIDGLRVSDSSFKLPAMHVAACVQAPSLIDTLDANNIDFTNLTALTNDR